VGPGGANPLLDNAQRAPEPGGGPPSKLALAAGENIAAAAAAFPQPGDALSVPHPWRQSAAELQRQRPGLRLIVPAGQAAFEAPRPPCCVRLASGVEVGPPQRRTACGRSYFSLPPPRPSP